MSPEVPKATVAEAAGHARGSWSEVDSRAIVEAGGKDSRTAMTDDGRRSTTMTDNSKGGKTGEKPQDSSKRYTVKVPPTRRKYNDMKQSLD